MFIFSYKLYFNNSDVKKSTHQILNSLYSFSLSVFFYSYVLNVKFTKITQLDKEKSKITVDSFSFLTFHI